ncbi:hypothetical protein ABZX40_30960 [Streptomyces sp. NPDC004610]|uniref:hypothetical protein n=1 Tax=unclassified Streptomyces TaxID=2593676 RepID=UPI0033B1687B
MNDDELLARLRAADPALTSSAPPPDIDRLVEATLNTPDTPSTLDTPTTPTTLDSPTTPDTPTTTHLAQPQAIARRKRRGLLGLAAATALLLLGGGITAGIMAADGGGDTTPDATGPLTLVADGTPAKCAEPTPDTLRGYPTLFQGTVTSIEGTTVTFRVDYWLTGADGAETVLLESDPDRPEALTFTAGEPYLVAAENGVVPPCGANWISPEAGAQFREAFRA